jgi:hypothetical protein
VFYTADFLPLNFNVYVKLSLQYLIPATEALLFCLDSLLGLARAQDADHGVMLGDADVKSAIAATGAVTLKNTELLAAIRSSGTDFRAFFAWLQNALAQLDESTKSANQVGCRFDAV